MIVRRLSRDVRTVATGLRAATGGSLIGTVRMLRAIRVHGRNLSGVVAGAAARRPEAVALVDRDGPVTAAWLDATANQVADVVRGRGDRRVGVVVGDHRGFVVALAGVLRAGADAVLIGPSSGAVEQAEIVRREGLAAVVRDAGPGEAATVAGLVIHPVDDGDAPRPGRADGPRPGRGDASRPGRADGPRPGRADAPRPMRAPRVVMLSAGTTGVPTAANGRPTTMRLVPALGLLAETGIRRGEPVLVLPPLFHGHGLAALIAGVLVGAPVVLAPGRIGGEICAAVARHGVRVVTGVPVHLHRWADHLRAEHVGAEQRGEHVGAEQRGAGLLDTRAPGAQPPGAQLPGAQPHEARSACACAPALRRVVSGSATLSAEVVDTLVDHLGPVVIDMFGSTQTGTLTVARSADLRAAPGTVGRPAPGVRVAVVDEAGLRLPPGTEGRVVMVDRRREVPTGDLGVLEQGRLFLRGRIDDVVVCGGENVHPAQVAAFLAEQPGVGDVVVGAVGDPVFGARLVADVVLDPLGPLTSATASDVLRAAVRTGLAPHKVPLVRVVDELPHCAVGKPRASR